MRASLRDLEYVLGFDRKTLRGLAEVAGKHYDPFDYRPHSGAKWRHIDAPDAFLKAVQKRVLTEILYKHPLPASMTGGIPGRSLIDHVRPHVGQDVVFTADLSACFPSIGPSDVYRVFANDFRFSPQLAGLLTRLTTYSRRLPQGAPTSPYLAALVLRRMHEELASLASRTGMRFTQFVDDLAFSGPRGNERFLNDIAMIVARHGGRLARSKTRVMPRSSPQEVCGLVVNRVPSAGRARMTDIVEHVRTLRDALFVLAPELRRLEGAINFVRAINPSQGDRLLRFAERVLPPERDAPILGAPRRQTRRCANAARHGNAARRTRSTSEIATTQLSFAGMGRRTAVAVSRNDQRRRSNATSRRSAVIQWQLFSTVE